LRANIRRGDAETRRKTQSGKEEEEEEEEEAEEDEAEGGGTRGLWQPGKRKRLRSLE
jgi:hypothetical protein